MSDCRDVASLRLKNLSNFWRKTCLGRLSCRIGAKVKICTRAWGSSAKPQFRNLSTFDHEWSQNHEWSLGFQTCMTQLNGIPIYAPRISPRPRALLRLRRERRSQSHRELYASIR